MGDVANQQTGSSAVLLVGHGTRDKSGLAEFNRLAELAASCLRGMRVEIAYLELAEPTIPEAIERLAAEGTRSIRVVPLLLLAAGHAKRDLPAAVESAARRHPRLNVEIAPAFGCDEEILALSARRFEESLAERSVVPRKRTMLLLVGRGTSDADALDEVRQFAELRRVQSDVGGAEVCFVAAARPSLAEGLAMAAQSGYPRVVVQPHLLFAGQVLDEIQAAARLIESQRTGVEWILARHLGPEHELVCAVVRRVELEEQDFDGFAGGPRTIARRKADKGVGGRQSTEIGATAPADGFGEQLALFAANGGWKICRPVAAVHKVANQNRWQLAQSR